MDAVIITLASDDGTETRECSFSVDDYDANEAGIPVYLEKRGYPKIRTEWRPDFHEVSRCVVRDIDPMPERAE